MLKDKKELEVIGCAEHLEWQKEAADRGITLVKDTQQNLPINPVNKKPTIIKIIDRFPPRFASGTSECLHLIGL